jgi:hypothetical protein
VIAYTKPLLATAHFLIVGIPDLATEMLFEKIYLSTCLTGYRAQCIQDNFISSYTQVVPMQELIRAEVSYKTRQVIPVMPHISNNNS